MKKFILGAILAFSVISCTQEGEPGKDGINGKDGTNGTNGTTTDQGKQFVIITGNITNQQAAAQIAEELGPNTEHISVSYTTGLTTLDLSVLTSNWEVTISNNRDLTSVNLNGLITTNNLNVGYNDKLQTVSLNNLTTANSLSLGYGSANSITSLNLPQLKNGSVFVGGALLTSLNLPLLENGNVYVSGTAISSLSLPLLKNSNVNVSGATITSLNLPQLESGSINASGAALSSLSLPSFTTGALTISGTALTSLDLPLFNIATNPLNINSNKKLTSIKIPNLKSITLNSPLGVYLPSNALPSTEINKLLNFFNTKVTFTGEGSKVIYLHSQTPQAPPTGQGITDKNALVSKGFTVYTD